jgi:hypothetical protein
VRTTLVVRPGYKTPIKLAFAKFSTAGTHGMDSVYWFEAMRAEVAAGVLRCVQDDVNSSPALEIPEWMFDSGICNEMKRESLAYVSSAALLTLMSLLSATSDPVESTVVEAQHLSSSSGDADAYAVTLEDQSGRVVFSTRKAAAVASGSASEDGPSAARMLNEHLLRRPSPAREVGDE